MPTWAMLSFQDSASPSMEQLSGFHDITMIILVMVTALVAMNMISICMSKMTNRFLLQEQTIEIMWTIIPVFILFSIALPSLQTLYLLDDPMLPSISVKVTGHQWFWSYEYSDFPSVVFDSYMLPYDTLSNFTRLLNPDNSVVIPTNTPIRLLVTASDVIHAWTVPSLGVKVDAVPGRLNQLSFSITRVGAFYGQCSEICGSNHSFMPIKIEATPMSDFITWTLNT